MRLHTQTSFEEQIVVAWEGIILGWEVERLEVVGVGTAWPHTHLKRS